MEISQILQNLDDVLLDLEKGKFPDQSYQPNHWTSNFDVICLDWNSETEELNEENICKQFENPSVFPLFIKKEDQYYFCFFEKDEWKILPLRGNVFFQEASFSSTVQKKINFENLIDVERLRNRHWWKTWYEFIGRGIAKIMAGAEGILTTGAVLAVIAIFGFTTSPLIVLGIALFFFIAGAAVNWFVFRTSVPSLLEDLIGTEKSLKKNNKKNAVKNNFWNYGIPFFLALCTAWPLTRLVLKSYWTSMRDLPTLMSQILPTKVMTWITAFTAKHALLSAVLAFLPHVVFFVGMVVAVVAFVCYVGWLYKSLSEWARTKDPLKEAHQYLRSLVYSAVEVCHLNDESSKKLHSLLEYSASIKNKLQNKMNNQALEEYVRTLLMHPYDSAYIVAGKQVYYWSASKKSCTLLSSGQAFQYFSENFACEKCKECNKERLTFDELNKIREKINPEDTNKRWRIYLKRGVNILFYPLIITGVITLMRTASVGVLHFASRLFDSGVKAVVYSYMGIAALGRLPAVSAAFSKINKLFSFMSRKGPVVCDYLYFDLTKSSNLNSDKLRNISDSYEKQFGIPILVKKGNNEYFIYQYQSTKKGEQEREENSDNPREWKETLLSQLDSKSESLLSSKNPCSDPLECCSPLSSDFIKLLKEENAFLGFTEREADISRFKTAFMMIGCFLLVIVNAFGRAAILFENGVTDLLEIVGAAASMATSFFVGGSNVPEGAEVYYTDMRTKIQIDEKGKVLPSETWCQKGIGFFSRIGCGSDKVDDQQDFTADRMNKSFEC